MKIKGIDVSAWQGQIDWLTVAKYGMGFAILRITEAGNVIDSTFERNYQGCIQNNIPVGVYKYSYASSIAEIQRERRKLFLCLITARFNYLCGWTWNITIRDHLDQKVYIKWLMLSVRSLLQPVINLEFIATWIGT